MSITKDNRMWPMHDSPKPLAIAPNPRLRARAEGARMAPGQTPVRAVPARTGGTAGTVEGCNVVILPWPPKGLSPNSRTHWRAKAPIAKAYKQACWALTLEAGVVVPDSPMLALWLDFYPPDKRHRDDDNLIASFKHGRDGVALALGIDDKRFRTFSYVQDKIGGFVRVRITELPV